MLISIQCSGKLLHQAKVKVEVEAKIEVETKVEVKAKVEIERVSASTLTLILNHESKLNHSECGEHSEKCLSVPKTPAAG